MLLDYIHTALRKADYRKLDDGSWFAEIPGFQGVWANANSVEECRAELIAVLEDWIMFKLRDHEPLPEIGVEIAPRRLHVE